MAAPRRSRPVESPSRAGSLALVGNALALDFANTSSGRGTPTHREHLRDFDTLMRWIEHVHVLPPHDCAYISATVGARGKRARRIVDRMLDVRELIWMIATALAEERTVAEKLRAALTAAHAESLAFAEIKMRDGTFIWTWDPRRDIQAALLGPITLSALTLLMEKDLTRTKRCAGKDCGWLFFDTTKNARRRWCEMSVCGNRAKVRAARARQRLAARRAGAARA
jgi:predicted RNA-binding Zn ribbon-like protein